MTKNDLYGWVFTYNPVTGNWRACTREKYLTLFSVSEENFPRSRDLITLQEFIMKQEGNEELIMKLVKES